MTHNYVDLEKYFYYEITKNTLKIVAKVVVKQDRIKKTLILLRDRSAVEALFEVCESHNEVERKIVDAEDKYLMFGAVFFEDDYDTKKSIVNDFMDTLRKKLSSK